MRNQFETSGRVEVQSEAPEKLSRAVRAIRERLEKDGAIVSQTSEDGLFFKGEPFFHQMLVCRMSNNLRGLTNGEVRFQSVGDRITIEYRVRHSHWPAIILGLVIGWVFITVILGLSTFAIILPAMLLAPWLGSTARARGFGWYCQKAAMRGLIEGAKEELHLWQTKTVPERAR